MQATHAVAAHIYNKQHNICDGAEHNAALSNTKL